MVTFPAYDSTSIQAASATDETLESVRASLESVRAEARKLENKKKKLRLLLEV
jgi:phage head maturation protease